jgi:DNA-binding XRE family transcriptional regulator
MAQVQRYAYVNGTEIQGQTELRYQTPSTRAAGLPKPNTGSLVSRHYRCRHRQILVLLAHFAIAITETRLLLQAKCSLLSRDTGWYNLVSKIEPHIMPSREDQETGKRLRQYRLNAGLTQAALAEKSGIEANTIARLESGEHTPAHTTLKKLSQALIITISDILGY